MRLVAYAGTSVALAAGIILKALHTRPNFYSVCVYFAESNAALMILSNLVLLLIGSILIGLQHLLYGPLRPIEIEQLYEKAWFAVTETCLAMTIFREELGVWFVIMFVSLLVAKVWGWIGEGRLEILEQQPPENPRLFHARLSTSLVLSMALNVWLLNYSIHTVRQTNRPNMMVMFAFEFALLNVSSLSTLLRYGIMLQESLIVRDQTKTALQARRKEIEEQRKAERDAALDAGDLVPEEPPIEEVLDEMDVDVPGWEEKSRWVFYLDLTTDFLRLLLYVTFFCVLCRLYGMPIHIIRDVALVVRSFYRRVTDFIKYRHATRDMHARYPDATEEEIRTQDVCIICREGMQVVIQTGTTPISPLDERLRPKKLPCGHILHFSCLRSWLERQQNCPTCRQPVLSSPTTQPNNRTNPPANNPARGVQPANNGNQAPPVNANQGNAQLNRMRTFNIGPLRLTVGTGHILRPPQAGTNRQPNTLPGTDPHQSSAHHPVTTQSSTIEMTTGNMIQSSITSLERMLMQETIRLRLQTEQLNVLRAMQIELNRLRVSQGLQQQAFGQTHTSGASTPIPHIHGTAPTQVSTFSANNSSETISSGSTNLPAGIIIPEGWTLLPLQRLPDQNGLQPIPNPGTMMQPQQRSRSLEPSRQPLPSMHIPPPGNTLPLVSVQSPASPPPSSMFIPSETATGNVAHGGEDKATNDSTIVETTSEPQATSSWQWPTLSPSDSPSTATNTAPKTENSSQIESSSTSIQDVGTSKKRSVTVEDGSDED